MDDKIINVLSTIPKEILIKCAHTQIMQNYAKVLHKNGIVVIPFLCLNKQIQWNKDFFDMQSEFPEYLPTATKFINGGFGAYGNPSSFHHPTIRKYRKNMYKFVKSLFVEFEKIGNEKPRNIEMLYDRICLRKKAHGSPGAENWHRDICMSCHPGTDLIFGGWLNLDIDTPEQRKQLFVGLKKSHLETNIGSGTGFSVIDKSYHSSLNERLLSQANCTEFGGATNEDGKLIIPPGSMVIFYQKLIHSVESKPPPIKPSIRIFHGYRLTYDEPGTSLFPIEEVIEDSDVPHIPSGQKPPVYSSNHYINIRKLEQWTEETFIPEVRYQRETFIKENNNIPAHFEHYYTPGDPSDSNIPRKGNTQRSPALETNRIRAMASLRKYGLPIYEYSEYDKAIMHVQKL